MSQVLIVDPHAVDLNIAQEGFKLSYSKTVKEATTAVRENPPDLVTTETDLPDGDAQDVIRLGCLREPSIPVVVCSADYTSDTVFSAIRAGAFDCLGKPLSITVIKLTLARLSHGGNRRRRNAKVPTLPCADIVVGGNAEMIRAYRTAASTAPTGANVLIRGQSGTGKELLARSVHAASERSGPFVAVNCAAVMDSLAESELFGHERGAFTGATERRKGCFELANRGTLFLDEIGDAPLSLQAKLLRALDRGEFYRVGGRDLVRPNLRLVAATNRNLESMVADGAFRADLYYRLAEVTVRLPPLAERRDDIPTLATRLLERIGSKVGIEPVGISTDALIHLKGSPWPGNVRELQNVLTRGALSCRGSVIEPEDILQGAVDDGLPMGVPSLQDLERQHIREALQIAAWNRGKVCDLLGITRPTLRRKMREYGIESALSVDG